MLKVRDRDMPSKIRLQRVSDQRLFIAIAAVVPLFFITLAYVEQGWSLFDPKGQICIAVSALLLTAYWWLPSGFFPKSHRESIEVDQKSLQIVRGKQVWRGNFSDWQAFKVEMVVSQLGYNCCLIFYGREGKEFSFYFRNFMASEIERFLKDTPLRKWQ
ncbi:MAG: hypothetical protein CMH95_05655 [Oceanospirillaceae bacterium]|jgi:hypothetical protein|nr:hypothetical protein [Oceanospirillaceae bacterium]HCG77934.1 hypothetical protein [Oceanospirillales bacterium]|tara:strand:- start:1025 stop:1501 length:477 start_codon:yes stop_codon:yes gene_type:complete